jgi:hypothetical protein
MALRDKEMKLVMMKESSVYKEISTFHKRFLREMAHASTCDSRISLRRVWDDRAVCSDVEHLSCEW